MVLPGARRCDDCGKGSDRDFVPECLCATFKPRHDLRIHGAAIRLCVSLDLVAEAVREADLKSLSGFTRVLAHAGISQYPTHRAARAMRVHAALIWNGERVIMLLPFPWLRPAQVGQERRG